MKRAATITLIILSAFTFRAASQESFELFGSYQGMYNGTFLFADDHDEVIEFESCTEEVLADFDLKADTFNDHYFIVTYIILEEENEGDSIGVFQIVKLEELEIDN